MYCFVYYINDTNFEEIFEILQILSEDYFNHFPKIAEGFLMICIDCSLDSL